MRRVVVTGYGAVSCAGNSVSELWDSMVNGRCGLGPITKFDPAEYRTKIAGEVRNFDITKYMTAKDAKRLDMFCQYAIAAGDEAMASAGLSLDPAERGIDNNRFGVLVSTGIGGFVGKMMSLLFNILFRFVIAFFPRKKCRLTSWLWSPSSDFGAQENKNC